MSTRGVLTGAIIVGVVVLSLVGFAQMAETMRASPGQAPEKE